MYSWRMRSSGAQEFSCCALLPQDALPYNDYFEYYGPDYRLHMPVSNMENLNTREYLENVKVTRPRLKRSGISCVTAW